jgi:amino acid transporter
VAAEGTRERLGLPATVAIVVGGIVGTGIFTAPAAIAPYGWLSVPAFAIVSAGSLCLALSFGRLVRRTRRSGGPYVLSVAAELLHSLTTAEAPAPPRGALGIAVVAVALAFSLWMAGATGAESVQRGTVMLLLGIPAYVLVRARRESAG